MGGTCKAQQSNFLTLIYSAALPFPPSLFSNPFPKSLTLSLSSLPAPSRRDSWRPLQFSLASFKALPPLALLTPLSPSLPYSLPLPAPSSLLCQASLRFSPVVLGLPSSLPSSLPNPSFQACVSSAGPSDNVVDGIVTDHTYPEPQRARPAAVADEHTAAARLGLPLLGVDVRLPFKTHQAFHSVPGSRLGCGRRRGCRGRLRRGSSSGFLCPP